MKKTMVEGMVVKKKIEVDLLLVKLLKVEDL